MKNDREQDRNQDEKSIIKHFAEHLAEPHTQKTTQSSLRPQRKAPYTLKNRIKSRPAIQIVTKTSDDYDDELLRREKMMMNVCQIWEDSLLNGNEYTPPWIRTPEDLQVTRRQRLRSYPIEIYPMHEQSELFLDLGNHDSD